MGEAFSYASERTLAATARTTAGPQHPTYRLELGGRSDVVLAWPHDAREDQGQLVFGAAGTFFVQSNSPDGAVVAELASERPAARLVVPAGRYFPASAIACSAVSGCRGEAGGLGDGRPDPASPGGPPPDVLGRVVMNDDPVVFGIPPRTVVE